MGDRVDVNTFANSQCAIRDYMRFKLENEYMHEARVLVSSMGKTRYNDILKMLGSKGRFLILKCQNAQKFRVM